MAESEFEGLVEELVGLRRERCFPVGMRSSARDIAARLLALLFPHFSESIDSHPSDLKHELRMLQVDLEAFVDDLPEPHPGLPIGAVDRFLFSLPGLHAALARDARAIHHGDPASESVDEVILAYPGFFALAVHRLAHSLLKHGFPLLPRLMAEHAHHRTGIDIHPGASLGHSIMIDHGTGLVIGETAIVGNGVKLYQGVTLGASYVDKRLAKEKRHPTLEDNVIVYANATILGGDTVIGHDTIVGANAWISQSVPPFSVVGRHSDVRPRRSGTEAELEFYI